MPDFEFQPWERVSSEITDGAASPHICDKGGDWLFRRCGQLWFVRETASPGKEWNFVVPPHLVPPEERFGATRVNPLFAGVTYWNEEWFASCCRWFQLGEETGGLIAGWSRSTGWSLFPSLAEFLRSAWLLPFQLDTPAPIREMTSSALFALLEEERLNAGSDLCFSIRFAGLSTEEKNLLGIATRVETPQKFVHLFRCALRAFNSLWRNEDESFLMDLSASRTGCQFVLPFNHFDARQRALVNQLIRFFEPYQMFDQATLPSVVREMTEDGWTRCLRIDVDRPTQHDKLEAVMELRAWMEENWPDGVKHLAKVI